MQALFLKNKFKPLFVYETPGEIPKEGLKKYSFETIFTKWNIIESFSVDVLSCLSFELDVHLLFNEMPKSFIPLFCCAG